MPATATTAPIAIPAMAPELRPLLGDEFLAPEAVAFDGPGVKVTVGAINVTVTGPVPAPDEVEGAFVMNVPAQIKTVLDC